MRTGRYFSCFILFLAFVFFGKAQGVSSSLKDHQAFQSFSGPPLSAKFGELQAVKLVYYIEGNELSYLNHKQFRYHIDYCQRFYYEGELNVLEFNRENYSDNPKRKFLLADLNYVTGLDAYTISLSPTDKMTRKQMLQLYEVVKASVPAEFNLSFFENNEYVRSQNLAKSIPVLTAQEVFAESTYQAISKVKGYGTLKFVQDLEAEFYSLKADDILVLKETPLYLPPVAGVLVAEFQTPLSHLSILGRNRDIPICASKIVWEDPSARQLDGAKVRLEVKADKYVLAEVKNIPKKGGGLKAPRLNFLLHVDSLVQFDNADKKASHYIGNKAANFGALYRFSKDKDFKVPESAFAIPFSFYFNHVSDPKINELIQELLQETNQKKTPQEVKEQLAKIRAAIMHKPINADLICDLESLVMELGNETRFRFRSSTNAEDADGFSGAGLYDSKTGVLYDEAKSFEKAIKKVWASLWNEAAYQERTYYNIDQRDVFMGVLVHRSFPNEALNGVAVTKNIYREGAYGFVVNCQAGNENVVLPSEGLVSEQFICHPNNGKRAYQSNGSTEYISYSSLSPQESLLSKKERQHLANQLGLIKTEFYRKMGSKGPYLEFGLDIEFKLDGKARQLYIKQVRPF